MRKLILLLSLILPVFVFAQKKSKLKTNKEKISYALGLDLADSFKKLDIDKEVDFTIFIKAIYDEVNNRKLLMDKDSVDSMIKNYLDNKKQILRTENLKISEKFLTKNADVENVIITKTGLQYEVLKEGEGNIKPEEHDNITVNYVGRKINGKIFDSNIINNEGKPIEFSMDNIIKAWKEGLKLMNKNAIFRFYVPPSLAYGEGGAGDIEPNETLIFDIELLDFSSLNKEIAKFGNKYLNLGKENTEEEIDLNFEEIETTDKINE